MEVIILSCVSFIAGFITSSLQAKNKNKVQYITSSLQAKNKNKVQ